MKLLSAVHRWTGGFVGLLLAILGLTGAILVWEGEWIGVPGAHDPVRENAAAMAAIVERADAAGKLSRVTFASDEIGLHQLVYTDGSGAYVRQNGEIVAHWADQWQRPELWLFDLHHHLLAGAAGETLTGIAGFAGLGFVLSGVILWWRGRSRFRPTILPKRLAPGPVVKHHRDLGLLVAPLLALSLLTGLMMVFAPVRSVLIGLEDRPPRAVAGDLHVRPHAAIVRAKAMFPGAVLRRITLPSAADKPVVVRMRQPFEWTPNGRTQLSFQPDGNVVVEDARSANRTASIGEKLYPVHTGKAGGILMKLLMTGSGLSLFLLGSFATWSFWARRSLKRRRKRAAGLLARA